MDLKRESPGLLVIVRASYPHLLGVPLDLPREVFDIVRRLQKLFDQVIHLQREIRLARFALSEQQGRIDRGETASTGVRILRGLTQEQTCRQCVKKDDPHPMGHGTERCCSMMMDVESDSRETDSENIHQECEHQVFRDQGNA